MNWLDLVASRGQYAEDLQPPFPRHWPFTDVEVCVTQCLGAMPLNSRCRKIAFDPWISLDRELTLLVLLGC